jgi:microcystin-dependent protein
MSEQYLGQVMLFAGNFAPAGWALCQGQLLAISQNVALFSLLGTTYGGNGTSNFALPDLQGRVPIGMGNGYGLTPRVEGENGGSETTPLIAHTHGLPANASLGTTDAPSGAVPAGGGSYAATTDGTALAATDSAGTVAGPAETMNPFLVMNYCIALQGIYPSRS